MSPLRTSTTTMRWFASGVAPIFLLFSSFYVCMYMYIFLGRIDFIQYKGTLPKREEYS